jgi:TolB-like protein
MTRFAAALIAGLATAALAAERPTVAVLYFDVNHPDPNVQIFKKAFAQLLTVDLIADPKLKVVEREKLEEVLAELKLQSTKAFDPATAAKVGKLLGAKYQVTGSISLMLNGKDFAYQARVIDLEKGAAVATPAPMRVMGTADDLYDAEQKLAAMITAAIGRAEATTASNDVPPKRTRLKVETAVKYGQALDLLDKKDKAAAKAKLQEVVKEQPDFLLASLDLDKLVK